MAGATRRNPDPYQAKLFGLAHRFIVVSAVERPGFRPCPIVKPPADLDPNTDPKLLERARLMAWIDARATAMLKPFAAVSRQDTR